MHVTIEAKIKPEPAPVDTGLVLIDGRIRVGIEIVGITL